MTSLTENRRVGRRRMMPGAAGSASSACIMHIGRIKACSTGKSKAPVRFGGVFFPSLSQLRAFDAVVRTGGISSAAAALRRSQPAVSQAVQKLERDLGVKLLHRQQYGCRLTESGQLFGNRLTAFWARIEAGIRAAAEANAQRDVPMAKLVRRVTRGQILALSELHHYGSFAEAARHSNVSITSLHRSARNLEHQLELKLLQTCHSGLNVNSAGALLAQQVDLALRELATAEEAITASRCEGSQRLVLDIRHSEDARLSQRPRFLRAVQIASGG